MHTASLATKSAHNRLAISSAAAKKKTSGLINPAERTVLLWYKEVIDEHVFRHVSDREGEHGNHPATAPSHV